MSTPWLAVRKPLPARRALPLKAAALLLPLLAWAIVSYVPWVWHPLWMDVDSSDIGGGIQTQRYSTEALADIQEQRRADGQPPLRVVRANPAFLPAPHEVAKALYTAFTTEPARPKDPWLYERIRHSVWLLMQSFALAAVIAVPLGMICGTFDFFSKLIEPFIDFMRYLPAPLFGALMVAIFDLDDGPKIAVMFIGLFFNMLLVTANTTRTLDTAFLEAAQTLGASRKRLVLNVILPGTLPLVFTDLRVALGFGWVYLTVAELVGVKGGITEFLDQQKKFQHYDNVFAGIIILGVLGFIADQCLAYIGGLLFPWHSRRPAGWLRTFVRRLRQSPSHSGFESATPHPSILSRSEVANVDA